MQMLNNPQHAVQFEFLRSLGGRMRKSVPRLLLLREFGTHPLASQWFKSIICFWNKVATRGSGDPSDWLVLAMRENIKLSVSGDLPAQVRSGLWVSQFQKVLRSLGELSVWPDGVAAMHVDDDVPLPTVDVTQVTEAFHQHVFKPLLDVNINPRLASPTEVIYSTYEQWFASVPFPELHSEPASNWTSSFHSLGGLNRSHLLSLLRFRLGAHDLRVVSGRWEGRFGVPRPQRLCERCSEQCVEDEYHMVFECDAYEGLRDRYHSLFSDHGYNQSPASRSMAAFMHQDVHQVAAFIHDCLVTRSLGIDPVDFEDDCLGSESECFVSFGSAGSLPASDVDSFEFVSCSSGLSDPLSDSFLSEPHEPLVGS
jgi:hypothetical protein